MGANVKLEVTPTDLKMFAESIIQRTIMAQQEEQKAAIQREAEEIYLNTKQVRELLNVSQYTNILTLDKFAEHIASHGSKYNRADIYAVLMQTVDCMREMLLEGKRIEMGDLGVFSVSIQSQGAESLEAFNPAIHIEQLNVNWTPGDRFRNLLENAVFNLVPSRRAAKILLKSIKAGETTVDLTGGSEADKPTEGQV